MKKRKLDSKPRYFYAIFISLFLFFSGFAISYGINSFEFERVSNLQEGIYYDFFKTELSYDLFKENNCNLDLLDSLSKSLNFQGTMLQKFEDEFGKDNSHVIERKKYYTLLELSHFNFMKKIDKECNFNNNFILFFYSNDKKYLDDSEKIGKILTHLKEVNPSVLIYSFNSDSESPLIKELKKKYEIKKNIFILINEKYGLDYIENISQLENYL